MKELNYQPSDIARGLRTRSVGVLVPQLAHPYFGAMAIAAEKHLCANGYRTFLCSSEEDPAKESAYIDMLLGQRVAGVMLISTGTNEPNAKRLLDAKIPMVLVARDLAQGDVDRVLADNFRGAQELVHYLTGWMDTPGESVTQQKFHGVGEDWSAKAEAAQPMGQVGEARPVSRTGDLPAEPGVRHHDECPGGL